MYFAKFLVGIGAVLVVVFSVAVWLWQGALLYHPRPYDPAMLTMLPPRLVELAYMTEQGKQVAFYLPPHDGKTPKVLWVLFAGNGSLGLEWLRHLRPSTAPRAGWLFVDYPGYGHCSGRSSRGAIRTSSDDALIALQQYLPSLRPIVEGSLYVMGHSLGAAVALEFATRHVTQHVVLLAPFTSMYDIAASVVVWPLTLLLRERYDNRQALALLAQHHPPPLITLLHGEDDEVVPVTMGRVLGQEFPTLVTYHELPGVDHNLLSAALPLLAKVLPGREE